MSDSGNILVTMTNTQGTAEYQHFRRSCGGEGRRGLELYDTASHAVSSFTPIKPGQVGIYVCGATVQKLAAYRPHPRRRRVRRGAPLVRATGLQVTFVRNVTDIDDKILDRAAAAGQQWWSARISTNASSPRRTAKLGVEPPTYEPRATGHMIDMIDLIKKIIDNGHAYVVRDADGNPTGNVYFDVASWPHYGELTHQKQTAVSDAASEVTDAMGVRGQRGQRQVQPGRSGRYVPRQARSARFRAVEGSEGFRSARCALEHLLGTGRPGWHIECSAMSHRYLKDMFDIHGGGLDLRFPHHENEMAQTRAAGYDSAARWMRSAWVTAKGEKMSKSLGNGLSVPAVLAEHSAWVVRYALGSVQYRSMLEWSDQTFAEAQSAYDRVANFIERAGAAVGEQPSREEIMAISADALPADFVAAMNDDINVSGASAAIFTAIRSGNTLLSKLADRADSDVAKAEVREALVNVRAMLDTLGLDPLAEPWVSDGAAGGAAGAGADSAEHDALDKLVSEQLAERAEARKAKDFARADAIRDALGAAGIAIEDGPQGSTWSLK